MMFIGNLLAGGFNFEKNPVRLETAIVNAGKNAKYSADGKPLVYSTEAYILVKEIDEFVKSEIAKLVNIL